MITLKSIDKFNNTLDLYGLSTDDKPLETFEFEYVNYKIRNSSTFYEMDTTALFMYDEENHQWTEQ